MKPSNPWLIPGALLVSDCAMAFGAVGNDPQVSVVTDSRLGPPAAHGRDKVLAALRCRGITYEAASSLADARGKMLIVAGLVRGDTPAARLLGTTPKPVVQGPEALVIRKRQWQGRPAWVIGGSDDRGLMYGGLDVADRIGWSTNPDAPLEKLRETSEKPAVSERALSLYTMNRAYWESRFYDEAYWTRYLDLLARNRFNTLVVIFGYENGGFLAPPYPYFFDVEEYPDVRMVGLNAEQQQRNLDALNRLIANGSCRGLSVTLGIWDHIYRGGVQTGGVPGADEAKSKPTPGLVWGVTEKNLTSYTTAALVKFLRLVPAVDAIQFRMHDESGLKGGEQVEFWRSVFRTMKEHAPNVRIDARAKGMSDAVIDAGLDLGVPLRITTKYWMEQMGLPFHPTHINVQNQFDRRHSYADLLRYPQRYKMHWRLWNGGTARVLLWGDPEYAKRFAASTHLYDGDGFEVNEPLCTKMEAQPHDAQPFALLKPAACYDDYEFERYWHFFQVFGRVGYNPDTPAEVWDHEFETRFGKEAAPYIERALHRASWVLPRIVAACYPYGAFPMTRGWAEKQRLGDLPAYAKAEGSDIAQFASFDEEAQNLIAGRETAKTRPMETSRWFAETAADVLTQVAEAEQRVGAHRNKEFDSTIVDLKILANLALFHSRRIPAAISYRLYERTRDLPALGEAVVAEREAVAAWRSKGMPRLKKESNIPTEMLSFATSNARASRLAPRLARHLGRHQEEGLIGNYGNSGQEWQPEGQPVEVGVHDFPDPAIPKAVPRGVYDQQRNVGWVTVGCSHDMSSFAVESIRRWWREMGHPLYPKAGGILICADSGGRNGYRLRLWKLECSVGQTRRGWTSLCVISARHQLVAAAGDVYTDDLMMGLRGAGLCGHWKDELAALEQGLGRLENQWRVSSPIFRHRVAPRLPHTKPGDDHEPPTVVHQPITSAPAGQPLTVTAEVRDPSGVKWVRLRYRGVNQTFDYQTLPMQPAGVQDRYQTTVPAEQIVPRWDFMYYIEVMDNQGNGKIYPDFNKETPYVVVRLVR